MRYYRVVITDSSGTEIFFKSLGNMPLTSLLPNGQTNIAALNIEFDIPSAPAHVPAGNSYLRIWGLGLQDIGSAFNLNPPPGIAKYHTISIYAGMAAGLPLANPSQARLLVKGSIFQAFGNWVGTEQTVDIILAPPVGTTDLPSNIVLNWMANTTLASALQTTLSNAFPTFGVNINISSRLVQNHDEPSVHGSLTELGTLLNQISKRIITDSDYAGVSINYSDGVTIKVTDGTAAQAAPKMIAFTDLIGQPTWISPGVIQAKLVMRGDLDIQDMVTLPPSLVTNTSAAMTSLSGQPANMTTFSGNFTIQQIHYWGNFRQPDAASWNTTIDLTAPMPPGAGVSGGL